MSDHIIVIIRVMKVFFVQFFCVFLQHLLYIFCSVMSRLRLSFIDPIFAWNVPLVSLIFLKRSLVFPILLFSSISLHDCWGRLSYLSLLFFGTLHSDTYLSFSPLLFASLLFTAICKGSPDSYFAFLHFFSMGMILIPVSCTMSWTSVHCCIRHSIRFSPLNLFLTSTV